jgi:RND family efflux transporter MFP subunit
MSFSSMKAWVIAHKIKTGVGIAALALVGFIAFGGGEDGPFYDTQTAEQRTLVQTVEITGEVKPQSRVDVSFKTGGKLETVNVIVGQTVQEGDVLATLDAQEATFAMRRAASVLAQARANLAARQAQDSAEAIRIAEAQRDQAKANLEKATADIDQVRITSAEQVRVSEVALENARNNLTNSGSGADISVQTSVASLQASLNGGIATLSSALTEADAILGVENTGANDIFESVLGIYDTASLTRARGMFLAVRSAERRASTAVRVLSSASTATEVLAAGRATSDALQQAQWLLDETLNVLRNSGTNTGMSATELATKRSSVQTLRSSVATQFGTISAAVQALQTAENSRVTTRTQLENAVKTAEANLAIAKANQTSQVKAAETAIEIQRATLASAEATLSQRKNPARAVDLQVLRAQIQDAEIAYEQAVQRVADTELRAPLTGVIAEIIPSRGEQVAQNAKIMGLVATENATVETSVPEADIAKLAVDQRATVTLDAFGDDTRFSAKLVSVHPDRVKIQDAIFYRAVFAIEATDKALKPGMTANVVVTTGEVADAIVIPLRAVRSTDGMRSVRVLKNGKADQVDIELGLRGDDGRVQVLRGVNVGDEVIVGELTKAEYAARQAEKQQN